MTKKEEAVKLIKEKLNNQTFLTYKEIATITGYHPKYILKLKKEVMVKTGASPSTKFLIKYFDNWSINTTKAATDKPNFTLFSFLAKTLL